MLYKHLLKIGCLLVLPCFAWAQQSSIQVSYHYQETTLGDALVDLEQRFDLNFTYSPSRLPMDYHLNASANKMPVQDAMDNLFATSPIRHAFIGDQIVLRSDPGRLGQIETKAIQPRQKTPLYQEPRPTPPAITAIPTQEPKQISGGDQWLSDKLEEEDLERIAIAMENHKREMAMEEYDATHRLAQISLLPYFGTNTHRSNEVTNNVSINVFWGTSKAVDGFEIGGFANSVVEDMRGFQMAGGVNQVGRNVIGTQLAGLVNHTGGTVEGAQVAGVGNIVLDSMTGAQVAGLFNISKHHLDGKQTAGAFNWAKGDVERQISSFYNRARYVEKRQVGLVNVCDTTGKAPLGLLSFVKYGYNRVEVGATENMYVNLGAKFGIRKLYNIVHLGLRWDVVEQQTVDNLTSEAVYTTWSVGYGLGVVPRLGKKVLLNVEAVAMHVNEMDSWTSKLNLLGQFRTTFDYQLNGRMSFYAGPVLNVMWSQLYDASTDTYGSRIPVNPLWNEQQGETNFQGWIGFSAGIRL
ncbi:MAG: hypothetical protein ACRBG0_16870 [Lewinella sp.]|uniref:hypothetical protein n=1 Tax=Lewinella sp. TaxID=2004506 RepID=UPI003D6AA9B7